MCQGNYCYRYPHPAVTTDCVVFSHDGLILNVLLVKRGNEPYKGRWALPGGFLNPDETVEEGAVRELWEETGIKVPGLRQLRVYSAPDRDRRERIISVAFMAVIDPQEVTGGDDAVEARWFPLSELPDLAFDHNEILHDALLQLKQFAEPRFRRAVASDIPAVEAIMKKAVGKMLAEGKCQWDETYPTAVHIADDIERGIGHVLEIDGRPVAYGAILINGEPAYDNLDGKWLSDDDYVVVHRIAVDTDMSSRGLGRTFMNEVADYAVLNGVHSFKIDTNFDNSAMLHLLKSLGFSYCGEIHYPRGDRMAFEKPI